MRMPRLRIRTMMVAVLLTALLIAGGMELRRLSRLANYFRAKGRDADSAYKRVRAAATDAASVHETLLEVTRKSDALVQRLIDFAHSEDRAFLEATLESNRRTEQSTREDAERLARHADYYWILKQKYDRAARYPWLPVEPDPPEPE